MFVDPFEGSYPKANVKLRPYVYKDMEREQLVNATTQMANFAKWVREWTYINCWHANEYESAAMWDLYDKTNEAVAVGKNNSSNGVNIDIDISNLIRKVYVSPTAPQWLVELTGEVSRKYEITVPVVKSDLYSSPVF